MLVQHLDYKHTDNVQHIDRL